MSMSLRQKQKKKQKENRTQDVIEGDKLILISNTSVIL